MLNYQRVSSGKLTQTLKITILLSNGNSSSTPSLAGSMLIYWRLSIKKSPSTCILPVIMATWVFHRIEIQGKRDQQLEQENGSPTLRNPYIS